MSVDVIKRIDYSCDESLGNSSSVDLFMHGSHSHVIWGEMVSVPSNSDFQSLLNSVKSIENRLGNIEKSQRECLLKIQEHDRVITRISENEKKFFEEVCKKLKDSLSEGSPFFVQISSKIQNHIQTIQQTESLIKENVFRAENAKCVVENIAHTSIQTINKEMRVIQESCDRLKNSSVEFFADKQNKLEIQTMESQTMINDIQNRTAELENLYARIEIASEPFREKFSFLKRFKWLITGRV